MTVGSADTQGFRPFNRAAFCAAAACAGVSYVSRRFM
jgi:hypothetical protein